MSEKKKNLYLTTKLSTIIHLFIIIFILVETSKPPTPTINSNFPPE